MNRNLTYILLLLSIALEIRSQDYYKYNNNNFRSCKEFYEEIDVDEPDEERLNAVIFYLTNEIREKRKLNELAYNTLLEKSASIHSSNMVKYDFFDHVDRHSKKYRLPNDRAGIAGISNPFLAENIVEGFVLRYKAGELVYKGKPGEFMYHPGEDPIKPHTYLSLGELLLDMWMNSPPHKENILSSKAVELGCGTAFFFRKDFYEMPAVYATQNFQFYEAVQTNQ